MKLKPKLSFTIKDKGNLTRRQIDALLAIQDTGSQNQAAHTLGVAVPVLHRYIRKAERMFGERLIMSTPLGSRLTPTGKELLQQIQVYEDRITSYEGLAVGCTPISETVVRKSLSQLEMTPKESEDTDINIHVSDDPGNMRLMRLGELSLVVLDDPIWAYEYEPVPEVRMHEIGMDTLVHVQKGKEYVRYRYGAQRLGYLFLRERRVPHALRFVTSDLNAVLRSDLSFFINRSILERNDVELRSSTPELLFRHVIMALYVDGDERLDGLISLMRTFWSREKR